MIIMLSWLVCSFLYDYYVMWDGLVIILSGMVCSFLYDYSYYVEWDGLFLSTSVYDYYV